MLAKLSVERPRAEESLTSSLTSKSSDAWGCPPAAASSANLRREVFFSPRSMESRVPFRPSARPYGMLDESRTGNGTMGALCRSSSPAASRILRLQETWHWRV